MFGMCLGVGITQFFFFQEIDLLAIFLPLMRKHRKHVSKDMNSCAVLDCLVVLLNVDESSVLQGA